MGSCCSSNVKVTPQTLEIKTNNKKHEKKTNKEKVKDLIYFLEDPNESRNLQLKEFNRKDVETQSMLSTATGKSMVFPNPAEVEVLTHTPPKAATYVNIEDTFWSAKRRLVPDYSIMERIDQHVLKASPNLKDNASKLVEYLIKPCKSDVEKARAIVRWMGENIQYDTDFLETGVRGDQSVEGVLKSGRAVCDGYGTVFRHLGELAGLECEKISGQAKGAGYYPGCFDPERLSDGPGAHAWNAVKLYGEWYLSDATWAAGSAGTEGGRRKFTKQWKEMYFLSDPTYFVLTHMPLNGNQILLDEQHLLEPINDAKTWANFALVTPQAGVFRVRPITHKDSVIETSTGEITMKYVCSSQLSQWVSIKRIEKRGDKTVTVSGQNIDSMVALFTTEGEGTIIARFLEVGTYDLHLVGKIENGHPALQVPIRLMQYRVNVSSPTKKPALPGDSSKWGIQKEFTDAGYRVLYPQKCMVRTSSGLAIVKIQLPTNGHLPNMHRLYLSDAKNTKTEMNEYVIAGQRGNVGTYYAQCPHPGEYRLEVYAKYDKSETGGYYVGVAILIQCIKPIANPLKVNTNKSFFGVNEDFHKLGLVISAKTTILKVKVAKARVRVKKTKPVKFLKELHLITSSECTIEDAIETEEDGDVVTFTATLSQPGFYVLTLYATPASSTGSYPMVGRFGISYGSHI